MTEIELAKITEATANSPADLMDLRESLYTDEPGTNLLQFTPWAFRGQPSTYGTLAPSFQRVFHERKSIPAAIHIESKLIEAFRIHYKTIQERTPNMPELSAIQQGFDLRCLSVMQHYGVPTRLLDWTSDFWTAVYFACAGNPNENAELWFYDRSIFENQGEWLQGLDSLRNISENQLPIPEPAVLYMRNLNLVFEFDPKLTPRMKQQMAYHTVSADIFVDHASFLYDLFKHRSDERNSRIDFRRIVIAKECKEKALKFLDEDLTVNASSIFPDVEGLGRFLRWQLNSLLTTLL